MNQHINQNGPSVDLFPDEQTVAAMKLTDYLKWAACDDMPNPLSLPPIQRGFVWKPKQITDLWDSLLREMPIGSFMLQRHDKGSYSRVTTGSAEERVTQSGGSGFHLLDGQQRTLAMLLGWPEGEQDKGRRLWVDLGEDGKNGARFMLRITTQSQPFGFQRGTHEKLSRSERRQAYDSFCKKYRKYDGKPFHELPLDETRPWKAGTDEGLLFVQLRDVWKVARGEGPDGWETVCRDESARDRLHQLCGALCELEKSWIALVCVPKLDVPKERELEDPAHHPLTMLFERIATGGTRLSPEDLLFSMIKQVYPESFNFVHRVQEVVGELMTAPDYVMTAFRVACAIHDKPHADNANPSAREFHSYLKDGSLLGSEQLPGRLRELIMYQRNDKNLLVQAFVQLKSLLLYQQTTNIGLPLALFPYLGRPLVQVLLFWLVRYFLTFKEQPDSHLLDKSRGELIRFVLFWLLCKPKVNDAYRASKIAFEVLGKYPTDAPFPGKELYHRIVDGEDHSASFARLVKPTELLEGALELEPNSRLRSMDERFNKKTQEDGGMCQIFRHFWERKDLLLWLQRDYIDIEESFRNYPFLAGRDEKSEDSVPYDFDHLVPQAHWSDMRSAKLDESVSDKSVKDAFKWYRNSLGNAIGNYRIVDSSTNRERGDDPLANVLRDDEQKQAGVWKQNFAFDPSDEELKWWLLASPASPDAPDEEQRVWRDERIKAFQAAIEHRTLDLYKRFFDEAGFKDWIESDP